MLRPSGEVCTSDFETVDILNEPVWVWDAHWLQLLRRLPEGAVDRADIDMLRDLLITNPDGTECA